MRPSLPSNDQKTRVLVVDDEQSILDYLRLGLQYEGFEVDCATSGSQALRRFGDFRPDLVILDRMLPDGDGLSVCDELRNVSEVPILMLSARGEVEDRVEGLRRGADDYLPKPFKFEELLARAQALLRRAGRQSTRLLSYRDLELDPGSRRVRRAGQPVELTAREFDLLEFLMRWPERVLSREQILTQLWGFDFEGNTNVVEVHISSLRQKLDDPERQLIRTVRGVGYALGG
ncbi:MAG: response regulator transcription factor [Armatimonadetes bacterium]|nr:response regulator transcription factor [Armatimonadota bacterium]